MNRKSAKSSILQRAEAEGYVFKHFALEHVGRYSAEDADWNYKDVPHLHFVHRLAEAIPTMVSDDFITTLNTQLIFGIKVPLNVVTYEFSPGEHIYYTTLFFFILLIETRGRELAPLETCVTTTYSIGMPPLLRWCFPLLKWTITRNYRILMNDDIPMRERRGELRSRGFVFRKEHPTHSYADTQLIARQNVAAPYRNPDLPALDIDLQTAVPPATETLLGTDDDLGLRAKREADKVELYPRLCPHEGACLDESRITEGKMQCPWHGRQFTAICTVDLANPDFVGEYLTAFCRIVVRGSRLTLFPRRQER